MIKISTIFALGIFIAAIPFTGFPNDSAFPLKNILYVCSGLLIAVLSVLIRKELEEVLRFIYTGDVKKDTFSENTKEPTVEEPESIDEEDEKDDSE